MANNKRKNKDLPQVLILKRQYIQRFPNGQQVALYHSDVLDQFVTVPLDGSQFSNTTESILSQLQTISDNDDIEAIVFEDLSELNIDKECADIILEYISNNPDITESINSSDTNFLNILKEAVDVTLDVDEQNNETEIKE